MYTTYKYANFTDCVTPYKNTYNFRHKFHEKPSRFNMLACETKILYNTCVYAQRKIKRRIQTNSRFMKRVYNFGEFKTNLIRNECAFFFYHYYYWNAWNAGKKALGLFDAIRSKKFGVGALIWHSGTLLFLKWINGKFRVLESSNLSAPLFIITGGTTASRTGWRLLIFPTSRWHFLKEQGTQFTSKLNTQSKLPRGICIGLPKPTSESRKRADIENGGRK